MRFTLELTGVTSSVVSELMRKKLVANLVTEDAASYGDGETFSVTTKEIGTSEVYDILNVAQKWEQTGGR